MSLLRQITSFIYKSGKAITKLHIETGAETAMHILNFKTSLLKEIEEEHKVRITFAATESGNKYKITDISKSEDQDTLFVSEKDWDPEEYEEVKRPERIANVNTNQPAERTPNTNPNANPNRQGEGRNNNNRKKKPHNRKPEQKAVIEKKGILGKLKAIIGKR
jgi:hypothetical protein